MDSQRAKQIIDSAESIQVLYDGSPVWIENVKDNNSATVTFLENQRTTEAPIYKLVEVNPVKNI